MEPNKKWMSQHQLKIHTEAKSKGKTETKMIAQRRAKFEKEENIKRT
jgi:hypothetical protein